MSNSSAKTKAARRVRFSTQKRMHASLAMRSGSSSRATNLARFQTQPNLCNQRLSVAAETPTLRCTCICAASEAQLQRVRHQPKADGVRLSKASSERRKEGVNE